MSPSAPRAVSGRYRGRTDRFEVELRVDVDGPRPMRAVSADFTRLADGSQRGSLRLDAARVSATDARVTITGSARISWSSRTRRVTVTVDRSAPPAAPGRATLRLASPHGDSATTYRCAFESALFRTIRLEEACEVGVTKFDAYDTGSLPAPTLARTLTPVAAYAEAGIDMQVPLPTQRVDTTDAGADAAWSDAELQAAMVEHFTRWADIPQWAVWLLHASRHESDALAGPDDPKLQGLMFDRRGAQRQGCAVFYDAMLGSTPTSARTQLYTCVHELGHCLNLLHCWQGSIAHPPVPNRPDATSWMNYPYLYPGGEEDYWSAFGFAFDDLELSHIRHAFREDVIMGGSPFLSDAALTSAPGWGAAAANRDAGGLRLKLTVAPTIRYGLPVTADLALSATSPEPRRVAAGLGPRLGNVDIAIGRPRGGSIAFEPLLRHCRGGDSAHLRAGDPPICDTAFLHYGRDGYAFAEPGSYELQARYTAPDGSLVTSNLQRLRVDAPRTAADRAIGELTYGDESVGALMSLVGSDAPTLASGRSALDTIIARFPDHPAAMVARVVVAANDTRTFKTIQSTGTVQVRAPDFARARALLAPMIDLERVVAATARADATADARAVAGALDGVGRRAGQDPAVDAYVRSRRGEIAVAATALVCASAAQLAAAALAPGYPGRVGRAGLIGRTGLTATPGREHDDRHKKYGEGDATPPASTEG
jgi:hypothetical protein